MERPTLHHLAVGREASFSAEVVIAAPPVAVWAALTKSAGRRRWLNDAEVTSDWTPSSPIDLDVVLEGQVRHDRGTVLDADPPRLLRYSLWSSISRRADTPENRSLVTFRLTEIGDGRTSLVLTHERLGAAAAAPHARFFWSVALAVLRDELEGRASGSPLAVPDAAREQGG